MDGIHFTIPYVNPISACPPIGICLREAFSYLGESTRLHTPLQWLYNGGSHFYSVSRKLIGFKKEAKLEEVVMNLTKGKNSSWQFPMDITQREQLRSKFLVSILKQGWMLKMSKWKKSWNERFISFIKIEPQDFHLSGNTEPRLFLVSNFLEQADDVSLLLQSFPSEIVEIRYPKLFFNDVVSIERLEASRKFESEAVIESGFQESMEEMLIIQGVGRTLKMRELIPAALQNDVNCIHEWFSTLRTVSFSQRSLSRLANMNLGQLEFVRSPEEHTNVMTANEEEDASSPGFVNLVPPSLHQPLIDSSTIYGVSDAINRFLRNDYYTNMTDNGSVDTFSTAVSRDSKMQDSMDYSVFEPSSLAISYLNQYCLGDRHESTLKNANPDENIAHTQEFSPYSSLSLSGDSRGAGSSMLSHNGFAGMYCFLVNQGPERYSKVRD